MWVALVCRQLWQRFEFPKIEFYMIHVHHPLPSYIYICIFLIFILSFSLFFLEKVGALEMITSVQQYLITFIFFLFCYK